MKIRKVVILLAWLSLIGALGAVLWQRNQLTSLRAAQIQNSSSRTDSATVTSVVTEAPSAPDQDAASRELLQLRAQVTKLTARKRELAGVAKESEKLKVQLTAGATNSGGLPVAGYIRRNQAQFLGYSTPENTVQSWLWAIQNHDLERVLQALTPADAKTLQAGIRASGDPDGFFKGVGAIPGLAIQSRQTMPDGSEELLVYIAPQVPPQKLQLQLVNGEWKMSRF